MSLDQFANVISKPLGLGSGNPDETLSSFWGRGGGGKVGRFVMKLIDKVDRDHGFDAIELEPGGTAEEPHHMGNYEKQRKVEDAALKLALERDDLTDEAMEWADTAAKRQRLRESARDKQNKDRR